MTKRQEFGQANERRAEKYLRANKHHIVARNYRTRQGEVDLISTLRDRTIVFTEVRSKHDCAYGHPIETIDAKKQSRIRLAAQQFLYENPKYKGYACRFDVITVVGEGEQAVLEYFPDAFT